MPRVVSSADVPGLREYRFVPQDYESDCSFALITDPWVIANMKMTLDLNAAHCELVHGENCPCLARHVTYHEDMRPILVLHEAR